MLESAQVVIEGKKHKIIIIVYIDILLCSDLYMGWQKN